MRLKLPEDVQILKDTVGRFEENEVDPLGDLIEEEERIRADLAAKARELGLYGGMGYMKEHTAERFSRDVRLLRIVEGTSEIQRIIVARNFLN